MRFHEQGFSLTPMTEPPEHLLPPPETRRQANFCFQGVRLANGCSKRGANRLRDNSPLLVHEPSTTGQKHKHCPEQPEPVWWLCRRSRPYPSCSGCSRRRRRLCLQNLQCLLELRPTGYSANAKA